MERYTHVVNTEYPRVQLSLHMSETWQLSCRGSVIRVSLLTYTHEAE